MSNVYNVTLSYSDENTRYYKTAIRALVSDRRNKRVCVVKQMGKDNKHPHYHCLAETDTSIRGFRKRVSVYQRPVQQDGINCTTRQQYEIGQYWSYIKTDPSWKLIYIRGWSQEELEESSKLYPVTVRRKQITDLQMVPLLIAEGWEYPQRPGKYLRLLMDKGYDVFPWIYNMKRLAINLRFMSNTDHFDDAFVTADNTLTIL